jgi:hypothetical protein
MFVTRKHLSRRTVLRGIGVTLGLPLLDAMVPAQTPRHLPGSGVGRIEHDDLAWHYAPATIVGGVYDIAGGQLRPSLRLRRGGYRKPEDKPNAAHRYQQIPPPQLS